jgi:peptidoglycan/LPS O-acetylase OafA/YrhL
MALDGPHRTGFSVLSAWWATLGAPMLFGRSPTPGSEAGSLPRSAEPGRRVDGAGTEVGFGAYLGQFDSYRVVACLAVLLQHSLLWTVQPGNVIAWALVMLLHFSRTAFFFLTALVLTYAEITRPSTTWGFWRRRYVQLGVPFLTWTGIYWVFTLLTVTGAPTHAGSLLWHDVVFGYYQLYFAVVILQLYVVFPLVLRLLRRSRHHLVVMAVSLGFALVLAADLHYPNAFGPVGDATRWLAARWPWSRDPVTYQEQFVAGVLVALHFDQVRRFVERWCRPIVGGALAAGVAATLWYLVAVWTGSDTGRASDLYQPIAFVWFTAAVAGLEAATWWWFRRAPARRGRWPSALSAPALADLTGGIYLCHVLFINLVRSALDDSGAAAHLGWAGTVAATLVLTVVTACAFTALVQRTPLRWVLAGPVRPEQRQRLDQLAGLAPAPAPAAVAVAAGHESLGASDGTDGRRAYQA